MNSMQPVSSTGSTDPDDRRIRVLFVIGSLGAGGAERQVLEILRHLDRSRFAPSLYLASRSGELLGEVPSDVPIFACHDPTTPTPPTWQRAGFGRVARLRHLIGVLRSQRIQVTYDRTYLATLDAAVATWWCDLPRISASVADPEPEVRGHAKLSVRLWYAFARWAYRSATFVVANSAGLRQRLIDYFGLRPERVRVVRNLLDPSRLTTLLTAPAPAVPSEPFLIVTSGRLIEGKGLTELLAAVDELVHRRGQRLRLVILGQGPFEEPLRAEIARLKLDETVTLAGYVANPFPWYRQAQLFVLASRSEGSPNALLEALAAGTPIVSTDCEYGPRELLADGRRGRLVPVQDAKALADAIAAVIADEPAARRCADAAREEVLDEHDARTVCATLEELVVDAMTRSPRR